jgi:PhoPQ-activated pathogenicity-related protein
MAVLAAEVGLIFAYIAQIPNQPIYFYDDPNFNRSTEDRLIAWTWRSFLNSAEPSDPSVIARMPMTKAAKRGLDTITELTQVRLPEANIGKFVVLGASKRGWTTWSLAATDRRVVAQIPLVFSLLNMETGTLPQHNMDMDGGWSWALDPYWRENLTTDFFEPKFKRIYEVEDLYHYKERFTMPTLAMSSTGDYFFLLDDNHHWWDDIPGPHYLMMLPNAEHTMAPHYLQVVNTAVSFTVSVLRDIPIPKLSWVMEETEDGGSITFYTDPEPIEIKAYTARTLASDTRRDFRLVSQEPGETDPWAHPVVWRQIRDIQHRGEGVYYIEQKKVEGEWVAFFFEGEWEGQSSRRMVFTSQVNIIPNTYPTEPCTDAVSCMGWLV